MKTSVGCVQEDINDKVFIYVSLGHDCSIFMSCKIEAKVRLTVLASTLSCVCVGGKCVYLWENLSAKPFERTAELRGALFKNVSYGNRSHEEFGSSQSILQFTLMLNHVGS